MRVSNVFDGNDDNLNVDAPENLVQTIARIISDDDVTVISNLKGYLKDTETYFENHKNSFKQRGFVDLEDGKDTELISWIALVDELKSARYIYEFEWKEELDNFLSTLGESEEVKRKKLLLNSEWFERDNTVVEWCEILDKKWEPAGVCMAAIDLAYDCYILFPCDMVKFHNLSALTKTIEHRIDLGKNM